VTDAQAAEIVRHVQLPRNPENLPSDRANRQHEVCHTVGSHRVGRSNGSIHHHYAKSV